MSDFWSEQLVSDYLDDRLSQPDRERVEAHLQENLRDAETMVEFQRLRRALRDSRKYKLDDGFSDRVIQAINQLPDRIDVAIESSLTSQVTSTGRPKNWRSAAGMIGALAATLLLALFMVPRLQVPDPVALLDQTRDPAKGKETAVDEALPAPGRRKDTMRSESPAGGNAVADATENDEVSEPQSGDAEEKNEESVDDLPHPDFSKSATPKEVTDRDGIAETDPSMNDAISEKEEATSDSLVESRAQKLREVQPRDDEPASMAGRQAGGESANSRYKTGGYEVVVLDAPWTSGNALAIDSLESDFNVEFSGPVRRNSGSLFKQDMVADDLDLKGKSQTKESDSADKAIADGNADAGMGQADESGQVGEPLGGNGDSVVFEVEATQAELQQILARFEGRRIAWNESSGQWFEDQMKNYGQAGSENTEDEKAIGGGFGGGGRGSDVDSQRYRRDETDEVSAEGPRIRRLMRAEKQVDQPDQLEKKGLRGGGGGDGGSRARSSRRRAQPKSGEQATEASETAVQNRVTEGQSDAQKQGQDNLQKEEQDASIPPDSRSRKKNAETLKTQTESRNRYLLVIKLAETTDSVQPAPPTEAGKDK